MTETLGLCQFDPLRPYLAEVVRFTKPEGGSSISSLFFGAEHTKNPLALSFEEIPEGEIFASECFEESRKDPKGPLASRDPSE